MGLSEKLEKCIFEHEFWCIFQVSPFSLNRWAEFCRPFNQVLERFSNFYKNQHNLSLQDLVLYLVH